MSQTMPPPPPMSPMPYAPSGMEPTRTSAAAVTSLICGVLGCFIVTGIVAIITGIIGLKATKNPQVKGRGMAIAGLILGVVTTVAGGGCLVTTGGLAVWGYKQYAPAVESMKGLADAVSSGDVNKALPYVDTARVPEAKVKAIVDQLSPLGKPVNSSWTNPQVNANNGVTTIDLDGTINYPNSVNKGVTVQLTKQPDGTFKVTKLDVE